MIISVINTTAHEATATVNRLRPLHASATPAMSASRPATGAVVAYTMSGKVMIASVT